MTDAVARGPGDHGGTRLNAKQQRMDRKGSLHKKRGK